MRTFLSIVGAVLAVAIIMFLLIAAGNTFGGIPVILFLAASAFGIWRLVESEFTMTGLREWLGAYNVLHVYFLILMVTESYKSLNLDTTLPPNWDRFIVYMMTAATYALVGYFGRWRDNTLVAGQPWSLIAIIQGLFLVFFFFMPYVNVNPENLGWAADSWQLKALTYIPLGWWSASNSSVMNQVMFLHLGVFAFYVITAKFFDRAVRYVSLYWGMRCAYGAVVLWWGMRASDWTRELIEEHEHLAAASSVVWVIVTVAFIVGTLGWKIWRDMANSDVDYWFTAVSSPGVFKTFGSGGDITHVIANFTGVPEAQVGLPIFPGLWWVLTRNFNAIWQWMLLDLDRRADPRWFCIGTLWVGPGFAFPGIPYYTKVMELAEAMWAKFKSNPVLEKLGNHKFGTLQHVSNWNWSKGPLSTGQVDLVIKGSFGFRVINPMVMWGESSWLAAIENATDRLAGALVRIFRFTLYGLSGTISQLADRQDEIPETPNQSMIPEREEHPEARTEDRAFVMAVAQGSGGLVDERQLEDVDIADSTVQRAMSDDHSIHLLVQRLRVSRMPQPEIDNVVRQILIAQAMGRSGLDIALVGGVGGLLGGPAGGGGRGGGRGGGGGAP